MNVKKRRLEAIGLVEKNGEINVAELSALFGVSEMTIRRDLEALEREGVLKRVRRGAVSATSRAYEPPFALRSRSDVDTKAQIARAAADLISEGETVAIDVGTTTLAVAEALKNQRNITVLTSSLHVASVLADRQNIRLMVTGGIARPGERSLVGSLSEHAFEDFYCDVFFMGIGGVDVQAGLTEFNLDDARVKQEALKHCRKCIVVASASKIGKVAFTRVAGIEEVDTLVTDLSTVPPEKVEEFKAVGLQLVNANEQTEAKK